MRPVEMTGIVNRTTDFAQVRQNEDQKPVMEQAAFQTQFNSRSRKIQTLLLKSVILNGIMRNSMRRIKGRISIIPISKRR